VGRVDARSPARLDCAQQAWPVPSGTFGTKHPSR
jgi:hypothetical protein